MKSKKFSADLIEDVRKILALPISTEVPDFWQRWCRIGYVCGFSASKKGEVMRLASYGKLRHIAATAIANDDLNAFTRIPNRMGREAARQIGDLAYDTLVVGTKRLKP